MRKPAIVGWSVLVAVAGGLLFWQHVKLSRFDQDFRQGLAGTWSSELDNMSLTNVVLPDGSFTNQLIFRHSARTNTYQETGTWLVQGGSLIETVTSDTNPTARTPRSHAGRIISTNTGKFTVRWQGSPDEWVWQKVVH